MSELEFGRSLPKGMECVREATFTTPLEAKRALLKITFLIKGFALGAGYFFLVEPHPAGKGWIYFALSVTLGPLILWWLKVLWDRPKAESQVRRTVNQVKPSSLRAAFPDRNPIGFKQYMGAVSDRFAPMKSRLECGRTYFWSLLALLALGVVIRSLARAFPEVSDHIYRMKRVYLLFGALLMCAPFAGVLLRNTLRAIPRRSFLHIQDGAIHIRGHGRTINKKIPDGYIGTLVGDPSTQYKKGLALQERLRKRADPHE